MALETPPDSAKLQDICDTLSASTGCGISITMGDSREFASSIDHQSSSIQPTTKQVLAGELDHLDVTTEMAEQSSGLLEGCTLPIKSQGKCIATVTISAPLSEAKKFAAIVQVSVASLLHPEEERLKKELKESESRFRDFTEIAFDWLWEMGPDLRFTYLSGQVEEVLGASPEYMIGKTRQELHQTEVKKNGPMWRHHLKLIEARQPFSYFELAWRRLDGKYRYISISGKPLFDAAGSFLGYRGIGRDITERRQAEQKFRALVEGSIQGVYVHRDWQLLFINRSFADILGYDSITDMLSIDSVASLLPPHEKDRLRKIREARERGENVANRHEAEYQKKDGTIVWLESVNEMIDWGGKPAIQSTVIDITERKHAEYQLKKAHRELQNVLDAASLVSIIATDPYGMITLFNTGAERMLGYASSEVVGKCTPEIFHLKSEVIARRKELTEEYKRPIEGVDMFFLKAMEGGYEEREWTYVKKSGEQIQVNLGVTAVRDATGVITGYLGVSMDITRRNKQEGELRHLRNYLSNIIDSMPSALVGVDVNCRVTQWNTGAQNLTGLTTKNVLGKPLSLVFPRLSEDTQQIEKAISSHTEVTDLKRLHRHNGELHYEDVTIFPLIANGFEGAVIRVDDVTEQVHMEEMMIQSEKMLSVGGLAAGMAHEINNPLAGMMQTANVIKNRLSDKTIPANIRAAEIAGTSIEAVQRYMESRNILTMMNDISQSGKRAAEIVDNMLSFARKSDVSVSSYNLTALLDKTLELAATDYDLRRQYDFKLIHITRQYEDNLPLVLCEGAKIQQVLLNLFRNGAQAMQDANTTSPTFSLTTRYDSDLAMACIEIGDNGPGMDESTRKRIFEPFFTTKPVDVGTGLGLSVSYFIITENHNGQMSVDSTPGNGTRFTIQLPVGGKG